ncbi:MAG: hypothetical protein B1H40_00315 [Candidatus Latescibacteria bacterium 4484_181]|nr:MAG: hypothetical protein B1H40_00315 [Candidatus Latescibacteria bacterium 4484_181]RKY68813.1 MAG: hypothetical protein DRQ02_03125 [Candidatus Latescibacterota bacterium]RKY72361.1 MAG: hypothetical protein DRQ24_05220 [Candidatus Latescibacterota bacterium]
MQSIAKKCTPVLTALVFFLPLSAVQTQQVPSTHRLTIARLKYRGGGDWYNDPSIIPNLAREINRRTTMRVNEEEAVVEIETPELFQYPLLFMTGHGNIELSQQEAKRLRLYLIHGGFLYADDDYGMDKSFRRELKKVFPDKELVELPFSFPIYHFFYDLPHGLPKIHRHDGKPPQGFGIFDQGRLVVFYTYETNISDGWADPEVHGDPSEKREAAFRMGVNIVTYVLMH